MFRRPAADLYAAAREVKNSATFFCSHCTAQLQWWEFSLKYSLAAGHLEVEETAISQILLVQILIFLVAFCSKT